MANDDGLRCNEGEKAGLYVIEGSSNGGESSGGNAGIARNISVKARTDIF